MPFRGGYGTYWRGASGDGADPLASAISGFKGGWDEAGDRRRADQARAAEEERVRAAEARAQQAQQLDRERFEEERRQAVADELRLSVTRQDALRREQEAKNEKRGQLLLDAGFIAMPSLMGGPPSFVRGPSKAEREDASAVNRQVAVAKALQGVTSGQQLEEMRGAAKALGIAGAETMTLGELRQRVKLAEDEREYKQALGLRSVPVGGGSAGRGVPASAATNIGAYQNILAAADAAATAFKTAEDAGLNISGPIRGRVASVLQDWGIEKIDARETTARSMLSNIASEIMKQRSGGAITPQEFERLQPFLPSKNDTEDLARQKLADLRMYLRSQLDTSLNALEDGGYNVQNFRNRAAGAGKGSAMDELDGIGR
jgi:hypothetical protein